MKQNCQSYDIPSKFLKLSNTVVAKWLAELSPDVLMKVFSLTLSKLLVSLQFPKFVILNPHQTTDPFPFFLHYPKCLKNFYIKESTPS